MKAEPQFTKSDIERIIGGPVKSFNISSGAKKGDNVAGVLLAIEAIPEGSTSPLHLVYKAFPTDPGQRQYAIQFGVFRTETCMYEKIFTRIGELISLKPKVEPKSFPVVKYISGLNDDQNDYVCLEDVRPQGFVMQDKYSSLTQEEVALVMKELARFHACTNFLIRYEGEKMFEEDKRIHRIKYNGVTVEDPMIGAMFSKMIRGHLENSVELLEARDKKLAEHLRKFLEKNDHNSIHKFQRFNFHRTDKSIFPCIAHGDLWTNNILFKYATPGDRTTPEQVKFIDFQLTRRGNIFEDLGYFFWTSTTPNFRKNYLDKMLHTYYTAFQGHMEQLEFPMPQGFSRGTFIDGFYEGMLHTYLYMPFALGLQMGDLAFMEDPDAKKQGDNANGKETEANGSANGVNGDEKAEDSSAPFSGPGMDFEQIIKSDKKMHMLRMSHSPRAIQRLEDLTREIVEMGLL